MIVTKFQIGKSGVTPGVIESLTLALKHHKQIRVSVLKSSGRTRDNIKEMADTLVAQLPDPCKYHIIGFTIILIKQTLSKVKPSVKPVKK